MARALDLAAVKSGGLVSEDVIPRLFNISPVDLPMIDSIGKGKAHNIKKEFTDKVLAKPSSTNTLYENQSLAAVDNSKHGLRYGNYCQQMGKVIRTSQRGRDVELTYDDDEFLSQLMDAGEELRLDEEAAVVSRNAALAEDPGVAGALMAGACAWAIHGTQRGVGGADAVLSDPDGGIPTTVATAGAARGLTLSMFKQALRIGWDEGAKFNQVHGIGEMIENLSDFMFDKSARVATMQSDVAQSNRTTSVEGNGARASGVTAQAAVSIFVGSFGVIVLVPNRQMEVYDSTDGTPEDVCDLLFVDTRYPLLCRLHAFDTKTLSEDGLYDAEVLFVDSTFVPAATHAVTVIADLAAGTATVA